MIRLYREFKADLELRDAENDSGIPDIVGLAAPFYRAEDRGTQFTLFKGAVERIRATAFDHDLAGESDIYSTFNHNNDFVLGRERAGTLTVSKSERGLEYHIRGKDTRVYVDLVKDIERGDVPDSSFSFQIRADGSEWVEEETEAGTIDVRYLNNVKLFELGPVTNGAYKATETGVMRYDSDLQEAQESHQHWKTQRSHDLSVAKAKARIRLTPPLRMC